MLAIQIDWFSIITDYHDMHVYINSDGVSVGEFKVVIIILRSSYVQKNYTAFAAWR